MGGCLLPAQDSLAELRAVISDHLKNFLTPQDDNKDSEDDSKGLPGALAPVENAISELREWRNSPRRVGITQTAPAVSLRKGVEVAMAERWNYNPWKAAS